MPSSSIAAPVAGAVAELGHHFEIQRSLVDGANGYVFYGRNRVSEQEVVIKFYATESTGQRHNEPRLLCTVNSPHVLPILDARVVDGEWAYFATPLCRQGSLDDVIATGPSAQVAIDLALGISAGASAIHGVGLVHRDLKPANIVCEAGVPLIADFGSVRQLGDDGSVTSNSGHAILYRPPESVEHGVYRVTGDIYQIGLVTYQLLGGKLSYDPLSHLSKQQRLDYQSIEDPVDKSLFVDQAIIHLAATGKLVRLSTLPPWVTRRTKACIRKMTAPNPTNRYTRMSDAVADIQRARSGQLDWKPTATGAVLVGDRPIVVAAIAGLFDARYEDNGRRVKGAAIGTLAEVVTSLGG